MMLQYSFSGVRQNKCTVFVLFIKFYGNHFEHFAG